MRWPSHITTPRTSTDRSHTTSLDATVGGRAYPADVPTQTVLFSAESRTRSLSPSCAADFKACPLLYRLRTIDRLPDEAAPFRANR